MTHHFEHHMGCGCPECTGMMSHKKKLLCVMVFFGVMAIIHAFIAGMIHLKLHAKELFMRE